MLLTSFTSTESLRFPPQGFSLRWYKALLDADQMQAAAWSSLIVAFWTTLISAVLGTLGALAIARSESRFARVADVVFMSPLILPALAYGFAALVYIHLLGFHPSIPLLVLGHVVVCVPFVLRTTIAALAQVDPALFDASASLGAGRVMTFRRVTLPLIGRGIAAGAFLAFMYQSGALFGSMTLGENVQLPLEEYTDLDDDEQDDARNHGPRRRVADGRRAGSRLQAAQATDAGNQDGEYERLDEAGHVDEPCAADQRLRDERRRACGEHEDAAGNESRRGQRQRHAQEGPPWQVDCVTGGLQKCLAGPSGSGPITVSDRMAEIVYRRRHIEEGLRTRDYVAGAGPVIGSNYFDLAMLIDYWSDLGLNHHTEATSMLYAARECARLFLEEGHENAFRRHAQRTPARSSRSVR